jgi:hypothetical protein
MKYEVVLRRKVERGLSKLPLRVQKKLAVLANDLRDQGPVQPTWPNYSKLSRTEYHCHVERSWVACWRHEKQSIVIEVYDVGSREKAPY